MRTLWILIHFSIRVSHVLVCDHSTEGSAKKNGTSEEVPL
jgi:hypothetical protein